MATSIDGWKPHSIRRGNGRGLYEDIDAQIQAVSVPNASTTYPFGLAQVDNGEIALICSGGIDGTEYPFIRFSTDGGHSWSEFSRVPEGVGRPMMLTWLGGANLSFLGNKCFFSSDCGRTWESIEPSGSLNGGHFHMEGNGYVDLGADGRPAKLWEIGWQYEEGKSHPNDDATGIVRWSTDAGRTWDGEIAPPQWKYTDNYAGERFLRGVSEGAIVRAGNGWLVAALRTDMLARYLCQPNDDSLEGTAVSISRDEGQTWSEIDVLYDAGRHHANLLRLVNDDLLMTLIVRDDIRGQELATHNRGCDALVSSDNGSTWNLDRRYVLDAWPYYDPDW